jgi:hypothetical protein
MENFESMDFSDRCLLSMNKKEFSKNKDGKFYKIWTWYPNNVINELKAKGLIRIFFNSIFLTKKGKRKAHDLKNRYLDI